MVSIQTDLKESFAPTIGATFKYILTNSEDEQIVRVASQMVCSSYNNLGLPYIYHGIGRTNNFLESVNVGYSVGIYNSTSTDTEARSDQMRVWSPIIPNS